MWGKQSRRDFMQQCLERKSWSRAERANAVIAKALLSSALAPEERRTLHEALRVETSWARMMVLGMVNAILGLREGDAARAAKAMARAAEGYRGLKALARKKKVDPQPQMLTDFEEHCAKVLAAFEPPLPAGMDPVRTLTGVARRLRVRRKPRLSRTFNALDAVVTASRAARDVPIEGRVVRELAKMLNARVLLHYDGGRYLTLRSQAEHTLTTWSIRTLVRDRRLVARRVKAKPEFWRPEQRRPGGVLSFPIGSGIACLARRRPFGRREVHAVRAVLRFLAARRAGEAVPSASSVRGTIHGAGVATPLAGEGLVGSSRAWRRVLQVVRKVASTDCSIVLLGETGTGKERLARAIHATSPRSQHPFVAVNCGAVHPELLRSELFGHIRGAFTGADRNREGLFVRAHRGTLFLDEVGDMPPEMQVALLRVLEERLVTPLGSARPRPVDVRVLAATNRDLEEDVEQGRFRRDLFHRINVITIRVPPLRERLADLAELAQHLLARLPQRRTLHVDALTVLARYPWPGNVRELDNVLRAAALLVEGSELTPEVLGRLLQERQRITRSASPVGPDATAILEHLHQRWASAPELSRDLGISTRTVNRRLANLTRHGWVEASGEGRARRYRACREVTGSASVHPPA
jgi:DNA-binding NtrC family response regulator